MIGADNSPTRMRGPWRSPRMATGRPRAFAASRTRAIVAACCSCVLCEKLMRATLRPASIKLRNASGEQLDGPSVQTIFVRQNVKSRTVEGVLSRGDEVASQRFRLLGET